MSTCKDCLHNAVCEDHCENQHMEGWSICMIGVCHYAEKAEKIKEKLLKIKECDILFLINDFKYGSESSMKKIKEAIKTSNKTSLVVYLIFHLILHNRLQIHYLLYFLL